MSTTKSRRWVWFFLLLAVLTLAGVGFEVWYNLRQQLTPERLAAAWAQWRDKGPADYRVTYAVKHDHSPDLVSTEPQRYTVEVREGKVTSVTGSNGRALTPGEYEFDSMDALFAFIDWRLQADREPGRPRPFVTATFHARDRHVIHYVRSVMQTRERVEVTVELEARGP